MCKKCLNWMTKMKGKCLYWVTKMCRKCLCWVTRMYRKCLCWLTKVFCYVVWTCHEKSDVTRYSGHHFSRLDCFWPTHDQTKALSYCMREGKTKCKYFMMPVLLTKLKADSYSLSSTLHLWDGWLLSDRVIDTPDHQEHANLEEIEAEQMALWASNCSFGTRNMFAMCEGCGLLADS